ncbi:MAG: hypothetical protein ABW061_19095 [Polyangiaceae bacterium]
MSKKHVKQLNLHALGVAATLLLQAGYAGATTVTYSYSPTNCLPPNSDLTDPSSANTAYDGGRVTQSTVPGLFSSYTDFMCPFIKHPGFVEIESVVVYYSNTSGDALSCNLVSASLAGVQQWEDPHDLSNQTVFYGSSGGDFYWLYCDGLHSGDAVWGIDVTEYAP